MDRAKTYDQIEPLVKLCKAGKLFDVQDWVAAGNPVNLPFPPDRKIRRKIPLEIAIENGFHSLVEVLLEAGAVQEEHNYSAMSHALRKSRLDIIELLVTHGADIKSVDIQDVFDTYNPEIIEFFINHGAGLDSGRPLAYALCRKIRPALGVYKRHKDKFHTFPEQLNIALRHHCKEGSPKWVALLLWAGADQYAKGPDSPDDYPEEEDGVSAIELAALYGHVELFKLKAFRADPNLSAVGGVLHYACFSGKPEVLGIFLERGFDPRSLNDKGSSLVQVLLREMSRDYRLWDFRREERNIDSSRSRDYIKIIHMIARAGAQWEPDGRALGEGRRALLKMSTDYTMEFLWIMAEYGSCSKETAEKLIANRAIKDYVSAHSSRLNEIMASFEQSMNA